MLTQNLRTYEGAGPNAVFKKRNRNAESGSISPAGLMNSEVFVSPPKLEERRRVENEGCIYEHSLMQLAIIDCSHILIKNGMMQQSHEHFKFLYKVLYE